MAKRKSKSESASPLLPFQSGVQLAFLGWNRPVLHSAVDVLLARYSKGKEWDMDQVLVVLPGSMASRRLQVLMAERAANDRLILRPPRFLTLGKLPEELYQAKWPFASELTQGMAWVDVLRSTPAEELQPLLFEVPSSEQLSVWMDLARLLGNLHRELASDLLDFKDVADQLAGTAEEPRWRILAQLQRRYLDVLHEAGLWDIQSARRFALEHGEVADVKHDVVLVGTVDLNRAQRQFLAAIAPNVQVLIGAPESFGEGFDADGTLRSSFWQGLEIPIAEEQIHVRTTATEAAGELSVQLAKLGQSRGVREITVGVPDPTLVPALQETLAQSQVHLRYGPGVSIFSTPPLKILLAIEDYLDDGNIESFSNLVRIPWIEKWLKIHAKLPSEPSDGATGAEQANADPIPLPETFLNTLDEYLNHTLLRSVWVPEWPEVPGRPVFAAVVEAIDHWLDPIRQGKRTLSAWADPLRELFRSLSEFETVDRFQLEDHLVLRACREINLVLDRLASVPSNLNLEIAWTDAFAWLQQQLHGVQIPPLPREDAIEMLGWLDVALDDAPVLMLTGLHDGVIPESVNSDAFLPNRLRSELGLLDNARRYARDAYVMMTCLHTRERVELVMNRLSSNGDPLTPSRLMMAVPTELLPERVAQLISETEKPKDRVRGWNARRIQSNVPIPRPAPTHKITDMAVTDFKKYNECPYRFYLNRVCRLRSVDYHPFELDGGGFGDMVHKVLEGLKDSPVAESTKQDAISEWLLDQLDLYVRNRFGKLLPPALIIQVEQAKIRLTAFAKHQAAWAEQGWRIRHIEHKVERGEGIVWELPDGKMSIHGRIDRIDENIDTKEIAVWDYKTGDTADEPRKSHVNKNGEWSDWQLPLYGLLISKLNYNDLSKVRFGYILLPKNVEGTKFISADFKPEETAAAIEKAKELAGCVLRGEFWPPSDKIRPEYDEYENILQRKVVRPWDWQLELPENKWPENKLPDNQPPENEPTETDQAEQGAEQPATENGASQGKEGKDKSDRRDRVILPRMIQVEPMIAEPGPIEEWFKPSMILASAGTGKTYQLAARAIRLLFTNQPLDTILATTFTRKAAGEILQRILEWLSDGSRTSEGLNRLRGILDPMKIEYEHVRYQLARLCSHLHRFRVSTLDSFYSQLAKSFALELKLPPGWTLLDSAQEELFCREATTQLFDVIDQRSLRNLVYQLSKGEAVRGVRSEVESVIEDAYELYRQSPPEAWVHFEGPSRPEEARLTKAEEQLDAISLGNKLANDAKQTAIALYKAKKWDDFLAARIVSACTEEVPKYRGKELERGFIEPMKVLIRRAVAEFFAIRKSQLEATYGVLQKYDASLNILKQTRRVVTFSDVSERLAAWMRGLMEQQKRDQPSEPIPEMERISHRMDSSIDHLLLDEFQDTSPTQWQILKPFAEAILANKQRDRRKGSFFVVGDTKQAIYAWRGGVSEILESVGEQMRGINQEKLTKSRRSSPVVIDFVNRVFQGLVRHPNFLSDDDPKRIDGFRHPAVEKWIDRYFIDHTTVRSELPGVVELWNAKEQGEDTEEEEGAGGLGIDEQIADAIATLHRRSDKISIGVLTRRNADIASMISLLRDRGIEASQEGGNALVDTAPVVLICSALQVADHPGNRLAYFHLANSPLQSFWSEEVFADPIQISSDLRRRLDAIGFGGTVSALVEHLAPECTERDQERMQQLVQEAYRFEAGRQSLIQEFLERIKTIRVALPGGSRIRVMTIHQSKGLEFDAVFIPALDQPIIKQAPRLVAMRAERTGPPIAIIRNVSKELRSYLPTEWQIACEEAMTQQLGEAFCLFYVALTRACHALYLFAKPSKSAVKQWGSALHSVLANEQNMTEPGVLVYRSGDPDWMDKIAFEEEAEEGASQGKDSEVKLNELTIQLRVDGQVPRNPKWLAPSQHSESGKKPSSVPQTVLEEEVLGTDASIAIAHDQTEPLMKVWQREDSAGTVVGKLVHRWFEEVRTWIEDFRPDKSQLLRIAAAALTKEEMTQLQLDQLANRFLMHCQSPKIREVLSPERYRDWHQPVPLKLEVTNERRLLQSMDGELIRGVIDRCVLGSDSGRVVRAEIIDFKTDVRPDGLALEAWVQERSEYHAPQLNAYRRVICRQFSLHPEMVQTTLVLLSEEVVMPVDP